MVVSCIYICGLQIHLSLKNMYGLNHDCTDHCGISLPIVAVSFNGGGNGVRQENRRPVGST
jgi:hypothetical protein